MLPGPHETAARLIPQPLCRAQPAWRQTPLLTDAPEELSLLKSRILSMPSSPALEHAALCVRGPSLGLCNYVNRKR